MTNIGLTRTCFFVILLVVGISSAVQAMAQGVAIGRSNVSLDVVCPAIETLPPPGKRPWVNAAQRYHGTTYARAIDDYAIGMATYDEQALERAIGVLRGSIVSGAKLNAAGALHQLARIRRNTALLDQAIDLAVGEYHEYGTQSREYVYEFGRSSESSARLREIYLLMDKSGAKDGTEAVTLAAKAESLARSGEARLGKLQVNPSAPYFAVAAARSLFRQGILQADWTKIGKALEEMRTMLTDLTGEERIDHGAQLAAMLIYGAAHAPSDQQAAILLEGKMLADTLLNEAARKTFPAPGVDMISQLNETLAGSWLARGNGERDRCRRQVTLRALVATADLNEAKDDAMREDARRRLEAADRQLSALPAFEHAPDYQLDLAISFYRQMEDASATEQRSLRLRGEQAFRAAKRLYQACFCNDLASRFRELGEKFSPTATEPTTIP